MVWGLGPGPIHRITGWSLICTFQVGNFFMVTISKFKGGLYHTDIFGCATICGTENDFVAATFTRYMARGIVGRLATAP